MAEDHMARDETYTNKSKNTKRARILTRQKSKGAGIFTLKLNRMAWALYGLGPYGLEPIGMEPHGSGPYGLGPYSRETYDLGIYG